MNPETITVIRAVLDYRAVFNRVCAAMFVVRYMSDDIKKRAFVEALLYIGHHDSDSLDWKFGVRRQKILQEALWLLTKNPTLDKSINETAALLDFMLYNDNNLQWEYIFKLESGNKELGIK